MLFVVQPEVFQLPLWCLLGFAVLFCLTLVARVCAFFRLLRNILMVAVSLLNLHLLASCLNLWRYAAKDSLSVCWMSVKQLIDVWMSTFNIFNWRESLISSQVFCAVKASNIKVLTNPFDFACATLVLLSPVNSEAVSNLWANPQAVKSLSNLMWGYLVTKSFLEMFSFVQCIRFQCICLIHPQ